MKLPTIISLAAAGVSLAAFAAMASGSQGNINEADRTKVTQSLKAGGYELRRMEMEDGLIEVYATKDGVKFELKLDHQFNIIRVEQDD